MGNGKKARGVPAPDHATPPADMPAVTTIEVCPDVDAAPFPLDPKRIVAGGDLTAIGLMGNATQSGKAGVLLAITLPDGAQVAAQTTWALLRTAYAALMGSPVIADEVEPPAGDLRWLTDNGDVVEVYEAGDGWRYRVTARNGEKVEGGEAYTRPASAVIAANRHHPWFADAPEQS